MSFQNLSKACEKKTLVYHPKVKKKVMRAGGFSFYYYYFHMHMHMSVTTHVSYHLP